MVNPVSHRNLSFDILFDDAHLISGAGLTLTDQLIRKMRLGPLLDSCVDLGAHPGAPNPGYKLLTIIQSLVAGGECIDDVDILRSGSTKHVLSHTVAAPSTCGTHLRGYTFGHVRQLDKVSGILLQRAWEAGAGPGNAPITVDVDSTITPVCGYKKEGASYGYTHELGLHPLIATRATAGEVLHIRERKGSANTQRGIRPFISETMNRIRNAGGNGQITLRADSGFYSEDTVAHCEKKRLLYSITIQEYSTVKKAIESMLRLSWRSKNAKKELDFAMLPPANMEQMLHGSFSVPWHITSCAGCSSWGIQKDLGLLPRRFAQGSLVLQDDLCTMLGQ